MKINKVEKQTLVNVNLDIDERDLRLIRDLIGNLSYATYESMYSIGIVTPPLDLNEWCAAVDRLYPALVGHFGENED